MTLKFGFLSLADWHGSEDRYELNIMASVAEAKELSKWLDYHLPMSNHHFYNMSGQTDIVIGWILFNKEDAALFRLYHDLNVADWQWQ